jgi:Tol biopolymer transport system component
MNVCRLNVYDPQRLRRVTRIRVVVTVSIVVVILSLLVSTSCAVLYDGKNVTKRQLTTLGTNCDAEWSPDGSTIAYVSTEKGSDSSIWLIEPDGTNKRMITEPESRYDHTEPRWSPDGSKIAFLAHEPDVCYYVYVMSPDGSNLEKVTPCIRDYDLFNLRWSPDGSKLTYDSQSRITKQFSIWSMDHDGNNLKQLTTADNAYNSTWSPDGSKLAFVWSGGVNEEIWSMDPDGSNKVKLLPQDIGTSSFIQPTWSPDGSKLAFVTDYYSSSGNYWDIAVLDFADNNVKLLTEYRPEYYSPGGIVKEKSIKGDEFHPKWSPNGAKILFTTEEEYTDLWIMNADGRNKLQLADIEESEEAIIDPKWSPDGTKLVFEKKTFYTHDIMVATMSESLIAEPTPSPEPTSEVAETPEPSPTEPPTEAEETPSPSVSPAATLMPAPTVTESPAPEEGEPEVTPLVTTTPTATPSAVPGFEVLCMIIGLLGAAVVLGKARAKRYS